MSIDSFRDTFFFLSNFFECSVEFDGLTFRNAEAAFQSAKCPERAAEFVDLTPGQAKHRGKMVELRPSWNGIRVDVMRQVLRSKFNNPELREMLVATAPGELIEGNTWRDTFWGVCKGKGQNVLGKLLMELRAEYL